MLGEQFMVGSEVCGAVISVRFQVMQIAYFLPFIDELLAAFSIDIQEDIISIWNRNASDQATTTRIRYESNIYNMSG